MTDDELDKYIEILTSREMKALLQKIDNVSDQIEKLMLQDEIRELFNKNNISKGD